MTYKNGDANRKTHPAENDTGGWGWGILGFCVPVAGLILYVVWKDTKPKTSRLLGIGALISAIIGSVIYGLTFLFVRGILM